MAIGPGTETPSTGNVPSVVKAGHIPRWQGHAPAVSFSYPFPGARLQEQLAGIRPGRRTPMKKIICVAAMFLFATPAFAFHCPANMAEIDAALRWPIERFRPPSEKLVGISL